MSGREGRDHTRLQQGTLDSTELGAAPRRKHRAGQMRPSDKVVTLLLAQAELASTASTPASKPQPSY